MIRLRLYSRPGCHLCEQMRAVVDEVLQSSDFDAVVDEVDISGNSELESRYGLDIPVLEMDGRKIAKHRIAGHELRRAIVARRFPA